ncbi:MAG: cellulase [Eudoraea sp.]|nr:cellulase [Eudoraea sp.]
MIRFLLPVICLFLLQSCADSLPPYENTATDAIRLNQVGYYPATSKRALITEATTATEFKVVDLQKNKTVFTAKLSEPLLWDLAGETVRVADFGPLKQQGIFVIYVDGIGYSHPFEIKPAVLNKALKAAIKGQYYQRASMGLEKESAGLWERAMGHPDDSVLFHPSTGRSGVTASPKGWYDAGDYGKYVVNGALSLGQMLTLYEQYPTIIEDNDLTIPESGNEISDLLDELRYEMDWLLTMQDEDGGVFFKLTTKNFDGMVLPEDAIKQRYIIGKGTAPTLDFAAVAAKVSRAYKDIDAPYAKKCLVAAKKAWKWAQMHPDRNYTNPEDISTGEYGDTNFSQEFYWAAAELFVATQSVEYSDFLNDNPIDFDFVPGESWANYMHYIGAFSLLDHIANGPLKAQLQEAILQDANRLMAISETNDYFQPIQDFQWGSNSDVLNTAMIIAQAYRINPLPEYLNAVVGITDYVFGKNATGYSFLTGHGDKTPLFVHHRPSSADGIPEPIPGLISGGPNSRQQDKHEVEYPTNVAPMKSWIDVEPSFASNEVCLNWNAAAVYVLGFLEGETETFTP